MDIPENAQIVELPHDAMQNETPHAESANGGSTGFYDGDQNEAHKISLKEGLKNFVKNKYFIFALCTNFLTNFSNNLNSGSQTYFYKYAMNNEMLTASLNIYTLVPTVISLLFLTEPCVRKFGKKKSVYIGAGGHVIGYSLRGIAAITGNLGLLIFGTIIRI